MFVKKIFFLAYIFVMVAVTRRVGAVALFHNEEMNVVRLQNSKIEQRVHTVEEKRYVQRTTALSLRDTFLSYKESDWNLVGEIEVTLFDGEEILIKKDKVISYQEGYTTWIGRVDDDAANLVVMTIRDDSVSAHLNLGSSIYAIRPLGEGFHLLFQYNDEWKKGKPDFLTEEDLKNDFPHLHEKHVNALHEKETLSSPEAADNGTFVDLYVPYTDDAAAASSDIVTEIISGVAYTNQMLEDSCALFRYRLVGTEEFSYADSSAVSGGTVLGEISDPADGVLDGIETSRVALGADFVQIWVENITDVCGVAWAPLTATSSTTYGYSLMVRSCPAGVVGHELGHNFSLHHDRFQANTSKHDLNAGYGSGYGFISTQQSFVTTQSYATECAAYGLTCSSIPYYSNPNIVYRGESIGVPGRVDAVGKMNSVRVAVSNIYPAASAYSVDVTTGCDATTAENKIEQGCFVATATYGDFHHPYVKILRKFRGDFLLKSLMGKQFTKLYYRYSPPLASLIEKRPFLKNISQSILFPIVFSVQYFLEMTKSESQ